MTDIYVKQYEKPEVIKATEKVDKLIFSIISKSEDEEEWKEIEWADSNYFISSNGRVLSLCSKEPIILKSFPRNSYLSVSIYGHDRQVHRLVAKAFIDNPENKPIAHHIDHNKFNNCRNNLKWATHSENTLAYYNSKNNCDNSEESNNKTGE